MGGVLGVCSSFDDSGSSLDGGFIRIPSAVVHLRLF